MGKGGHRQELLDVEPHVDGPHRLRGRHRLLENGAGANLPRKHTVVVKPAERVSVAITCGLNNLEFREVVPFIGMSLDRSFGETATRVRQNGGDPRQIRFVAGLRMWF